MVGFGGRDLDAGLRMDVLRKPHRHGVFRPQSAVGFLFPLVGLIAADPACFRPAPCVRPVILLFSIGMIAAAVQKSLASALRGIPQWALSTGAAGVVTSAVTGFDGVFGVAPECCLALSFLLIVSGATVFGLLLTRPARRLGDISYGIYLLQGPVLLLAFSFPCAPGSLGRVASGPLGPRRRRRGDFDGFRDRDPQSCRAARHPGRAMGVKRNNRDPQRPRRHRNRRFRSVVWQGPQFRFRPDGPN